MFLLASIEGTGGLDEITYVGKVSDHLHLHK